MRPRPFLTALLLVISIATEAQYVAGDYGSWPASGNWATLSTWRVYDGVSWASSPVATAVPNATKRVFIRGGTTVTAVFGTSYFCRDLFVESGGKLYNNNTGATSLSYVSVFGTTLLCDGQIGNGTTLDGISFNIEGASVSLSGTGTFDAARIRKFYTANPTTLASAVTTSLTISMNVNLRFSGGGGTMMYNNASSASNFYVNIGSGAIVSLLGPAGFGHIAMDGVTGSDAAAAGGSYTVNGTLLVAGTLHLTTNNANTAQACSFTINNGGYVRAMQVSAPAAGNARQYLTINNGGTLEITGTPTAWTSFVSNANNVYTLQSGSRVIYSGNGAQNIANIGGTGYGHLRISGTGTKSLMGPTTVKGDLEIQNVSGTPELDVTAGNFQLNVGGNWTSYAQAGFNERMGVVQFNSTSSAQAISTTGGEQFHTWQLTKSNAQPTVTLNSSMQVANVIEFNGTGSVLHLNGQELRLLNPSPGAITTNGASFGTVKHIRSEQTNNQSRVRWDIGSSLGAHLVPFGSASAYIPLTFDLESGDAGSVTMATYGTPASNLPWPTTPVAVTNLQSAVGLSPDNRAATVDRFWQVDVSGSPVADVTFSYAPGELPTAPWNDPYSLHAQRWNSSVPMWEDQMEAAGAGPNYVIASNLSAFGPFTLTPVSAPLPVELLSFNARLIDQVVLLDWATATEHDNAFFTVLRSADGLQFKEVAVVNAMGNSLSTTTYSAIDHLPLPGLSYYRLRQTDTDGTWTETDLVPVLNDARAEDLIVSPNPVTDQLIVFGSITSEAHIRITDASGRVVREERPTGSIDRLSIPVQNLPAGSYLLSVLDGSGTRMARFVRQ